MDAERNVSMGSQNGINLGYLPCKQEDVKTEQINSIHRKKGVKHVKTHQGNNSNQNQLLSKTQKRKLRLRRKLAAENADNFLGVQLDINSIHRKKGVKHVKTQQGNNPNQNQLLSKTQKRKLRLRRKLAAENADNFLGVQLDSANNCLNPFINKIREHKNNMLKLSKCLLENENLEVRHTLSSSILKYCDQILKLQNHITDFKKELQITETDLKERQTETQQKKRKGRFYGAMKRYIKNSIKKEKMEAARDNMIKLEMSGLDLDTPIFNR